MSERHASINFKPVALGSASESGSPLGNESTDENTVAGGSSSASLFGTQLAGEYGSVASADPEVLVKAGASRSVIHKKAQMEYDPSTDWYSTHRYFIPTVNRTFTMAGTLAAANAGRSIGGSGIPSGSGLGVDASLAGSKKSAASSSSLAHDDAANTYFPSATKIAKKSNEDLIALCQKYGPNSESNLSALHAILYPLVDAEGRISLEDVKNAVKSLTVPNSNADYVIIWCMHIGVPVDALLTYEEVMNGFHQLFNGTSAKKTAKACFELCDITDAGFILKDEIKALRPSYAPAAGEGAQVSTTAPATNADLGNPSNAGESEESHGRLTTPTSALAAGGNRQPSAFASPSQTAGVGGSKIVQPSVGNPSISAVISPHLTYLVLKAVLRAFEHIAVAEEERVRLAQSKGKRKKKNAPLIMPTKRQFHINLTEFSQLLAKDPHLVLAFTPYAILCATDTME